MYLLAANARFGWRALGGCHQPAEVAQWHTGLSTLPAGQHWLSRLCLCEVLVFRAATAACALFLALLEDASLKGATVPPNTAALRVACTQLRPGVFEQVTLPLLAPKRLSTSARHKPLHKSTTLRSDAVTRLALQAELAPDTNLSLPALGLAAAALVRTGRGRKVAPLWLCS